ncbi:MAG: cation:proton antiporter [Solirubrobacterales bacterium]|nr:cation:proton antiporter [Solirubrobacterales bacterium]
MLGVVVLLMVVLLWALVARRLGRLSITSAIAVVVAGALLTAGSHPVIQIQLDTKIVERGVELTLAILLFIDATEVPGGILVRERGALTRLLGIALPLSLIVAWLAGFVLFSERDAWLLAVLAIIVVPVDLAPAVAIVRDRRVPERLREIMNVEAGLNDGVVAPLFLFCLAGATAKHAPAVQALKDAVPAILVAVCVGGAIGLSGAIALGWSSRRNWTEPSSLRLGVVALPVMTYVLAVALGGNGFVAAFVAGILFALRDHGLPREALQLTEDVATLLSLCVWFVFGRAVDQVLHAGVRLDVVAYAILALTVVRIVPVMVALRGTSISRLEAFFLGWMGPRGLASLVFGLLAVVALNGEPSSLTAQVMVITVLLSVILHGASAAPIAAAFARRSTPRRERQASAPAAARF